MRGIVAALFLLTASPSWGASTGDLMRACESASGTSGALLCSSYMNGLGAGILADQIAREDGTAICLPNGISTDEIRNTIKTYVDGKSIAILNLPAGSVVAAAMQSAYPCPKSNYDNTDH